MSREPSTHSKLRQVSALMSMASLALAAPVQVLAAEPTPSTAATAPATAPATTSAPAASTAPAPAGEQNGATAAEASVVAAAPAAEEKWPMRWETALGLGFNYLSPNNFIGNGGALEDRPDSGGLFALRGTGWFLDNVGAEVEFKLMPTSFRNDRIGGGASALVYGPRINAIYSFAPLAQFRPFVTAGVAVELFKAGKTQAEMAKQQIYAKSTDSDFAAMIGGGVQYQFLHRMGLRFDLRWLPMRGKEAADAKGNAENTLANNIEGLISVAYTIGGKPGDTDGDGVLDGRDQCEEQAEDKDGFQDQDGCPDPDNDGDGVLDAEDKCVNEAEDKDGYMDYDGCPEIDNDGDGVADGDDKCPGQKEDKDGFQDQDGCPDPDNDNDGLLDAKDKCPTEAEDKDGFEDDNGCPDPDNDKDGILDAKDKCPNQAETKNGVDDTDGCPDEVPDQDKDGIPDAQDQCPDKAESKNGFQDADGCPDEVPAALKKFTGAIQGIEFETGSAKILPKSTAVLQKAIAVLKEFPDTRIEIAGHTDNVGKAEDNQKLSEDRAAAVKAWMVENGIDAARIQTVGYGQTQPVEDNAKKGGQAKNRRIEFRLL